MAVTFSFADGIQKIVISSKFKLLVNNIIRIEGKRLGEICYAFVDESEILFINNRFLQHDYLTDVITFDHSRRGVISGDVIICPKVVFENAPIYDSSPMLELYRVMIHGILHLLGYNDGTEELKLEMRQKENLYLSLGIENCYIWDNEERDL